MAINLDGSGLTIEKLVAIARHGEKVALPEDALARIRRCRALLDEKINAREIMYGVNTGIGELSEVALDPERLMQFQRFLIYNHSAGIGEPAPIEHVRAAMVSRANVHANGCSACRPVITETLCRMLNRGVTPVMCERGSVGASGDLSPMAQMALVPMGEGEAFFEGNRLPGKEAMDRAGIPTVVYGFFAALTVAPFIRDTGGILGLSVSSESALAAGLGIAGGLGRGVPGPDGPRPWRASTRGGRRQPWDLGGRGSGVAWGRGAAVLESQDPQCPGPAAEARAERGEGASPQK